MEGSKRLDKEQSIHFKEAFLTSVSDPLVMCPSR